ncbi:MAG TPA: cytochrome c oxidase subunit II [bacterium]|nr:cytochrome c oxidase subunit II [bacterium]
MEPGVTVPRDERSAGRWMGALILFILAAGVVSFIVAAHIWWLQPLASRQGLFADEMFDAILVATGIAFIAVHLFVAIALIRYAAHGRRPAAHWHEHLGAELTWTLVPAAGLIVLAIFAEIVWAHVYSAPPANAQVVEVTARQFLWYVRYPGPDGKLARTDPKFISAGNPLGLDPGDADSKTNLVLTNDLHVVNNRPVRVVIHSLDVIHSFFLPNFRVKQDAVPGRTESVWFTPDRTGTFQIACAQLCGVGHYTMRGNIVVEPTQAAFDAWLATQGTH